MDELAGLVLAGGRSTRFGTDKALAVVDGATLLSRAVACLRSVCGGGPVLVASGDGRSRPGVADGELADVAGAEGPLAGIAAGLGALRDVAPAVAVLAVDTVSPSVTLLRLLAAQRAVTDAVCALAVVDGWPQPLHAVWGAAAADEVTAAVHAGRPSVLGFLDGRADVVRLDRAALDAAGVRRDATRDADRPGDLPGAPAR